MALQKPHPEEAGQRRLKTHQVDPGNNLVDTEIGICRKWFGAAQRTSR